MKKMSKRKMEAVVGGADISTPPLELKAEKEAEDSIGDYFKCVPLTARGKCFKAVPLTARGKC